MTLAEDNDTLLDMIHPLAAGALVARQWNYDERLRQKRREKVTRLKEKQRIAGTTKWAGRNSNSANTQMAVKRAIRDWFNAARGGQEGVAITVLVDAVIMLGLNHDFKQVQRTASSNAHDTIGGLLTLKGFTAALLACCSSFIQRDRLFRSLRGEGEEWRRYGGVGEQENGGDEVSPSGAAAMPTGVPTFVTQLAAYRRKVLMATVADRFPTPCTSTFWTPDCERHTDTRHSSTRGRRGVKASRLNENSNEQIPPSMPAGENPAAHSGITYTPEGAAVYSCGGSNAHEEEKLPTPRSSPSDSSIGVSVETRRRYDTILEGIFLSSASTPPLDSPIRGIRTASTASTPQQTFLKHKTQPRTPSPIVPGGATRGRCRTPKRSVTEISRKRVVGQAKGARISCNSRPSLTTGSIQALCATDASSWGRSNSSATHGKQCGSGRQADGVPESGRPIGDGGCSEEGIAETAGRLRDSMRQTELTLATSEARWGNYQVMKKRWQRRTPLGILTDDELDEDNRSYSRLSRPRTSEGTGGGDCGRTSGAADAGSISKQSSRLCTGSSVCRPSTAPASCSGGLGVGSSVAGLTTVTSNNSNRFRTRAGRHREGGEGGRTLSKSLPLGPIALEGGHRKLRYPFLQLKEKERAARTRRGNPEVEGGSALYSPGCAINRTGGHEEGARGFVDITVTREWKGETTPCLVRVPVD